MPGEKRRRSDNAEILKRVVHNRATLNEAIVHISGAAHSDIDVHGRLALSLGVKLEPSCVHRALGDSVFTTVEHELLVFLLEHLYLTDAKRANWCWLTDTMSYFLHSVFPEVKAIARTWLKQRDPPIDRMLTFSICDIQDPAEAFEAVKLTVFARDAEKVMKHSAELRLEGRFAELKSLDVAFKNMRHAMWFLCELTWRLHYGTFDSSLGSVALTIAPSLQKESMVLCIVQTLIKMMHSPERAFFAADMVQVLVNCNPFAPRILLSNLRTICSEDCDRVLKALFATLDREHLDLAQQVLKKSTNKKVAHAIAAFIERLSS